MLVVSECSAALPIVERVGLVTGDLGVLGGEGEADFPKKERQTLWLSIGMGLGALHSTVSTHAVFG